MRFLERREERQVWRSSGNMAEGVVFWEKLSFAFFRKKLLREFFFEKLMRAWS